jgi:hypothetical protein
MLIKLPQEGFGGIAPKVDPKNLGSNMAQTAQDVNLLGGTLAPYKGLTTVENLGVSTQNSLYKYRQKRYSMVCGAAGSNLAAFQAITDGAFFIGDEVYQVTGLDFSGDASFDDVASTIQTAMRDAGNGNMPSATCIWDTDHFVLTYTAELPYLSQGYSQEINTAAYGINTTDASGSANSAFDGNNTAGVYKITGATSLYVKKYYGASGGIRMTELYSRSAATFGYLFDYGTSPWSDADGTVTILVEGSNDDATYTTLGTVDVTDSAGLETTLDINDNTFYKYIKITISGVYSPVPSGIGIQLVDVRPTGYTYNGVTDISSSTYMNGRDGVATTSEYEDSEWITWVEEDISVVENPVASDIYARIYWTGENNKLRVKGTFPAQDVGFSAPEVVPSVALTDQYTPSFTGQTEIVTSVGTNNDAMTLVSIERTDVGYLVTFRMEALQYTSTTTPTFEFQFKIAGVLGGTTWVDASNIGTQYGQSVDGVTYAKIEMQSIVGNTYATRTGAGPSYTYDWLAQDVTLEINMNYWLQREASYYYLYTTVDSLSQESSPSPVSALTLRDAEDRAVVTMGSPGTTKRLYRSANGSDLTSGFYFVTETTEATYVDWTRDEDLVEQLSIHDNPVDGMQGLVVMPGGFALAFKNRTLYASEQYLLYSWLPDYEINFDSNIKALAVAGNECYVLTENKQYIVTGDSPDTLVSSRLMLNQTCETSNRGVAVVGRITLYPSPDGYVSLYGAQGEVATKELIQTRDWQDYLPSTFRAESYNKKLYACSDNTFFVIDFDAGLSALTTLSYDVNGLHYDAIDDILYAIVDEDIVSIDTNASVYDNLIWRSKEYWGITPWRPACIRVEAESYPTLNPITVRLYAEGSLVHTHTVTKDTATKIPRLRKEQSWYFEIESPSEIYDIQIATSIGELR